MYKHNENVTPISTESVMNAVPNKFDAILIAGARARELQRGHALKTPTKAVKVTVQALEEVAAGVLDAQEYMAKVK